MAIIRWEPFREMDRFFDEDFFPAAPAKIGWDLAVDVYEEKGNVIAKMQIPGIDAEKLDVSVEDNYLKVTGAREEEKETKEKNYYSKEIRRGSFERTVRLPVAVEGGKAVAEYKNGVLEVKIPKKMEKKEGKVKVSVKK